VWLYSGPTSGGVRSDRLVLFGAAKLKPVGSYAQHRCYIDIHYTYIYISIYYMHKGEYIGLFLREP
jgi:hypothetical protein